MANDSIGNRMKEQYENRTRYSLPRRTYTIVRVDGKAFHSYTRGFRRPFDFNFMFYMDMTAQELCRSMQGSQVAYVQSDEISVLLTDFDKPTTDAWFDGNLQKIVSVAASVATGEFGKWARADGHTQTAHFDARAFTIPDPIELENYFIWRQQDATRNSIQMAADALYSHRELHGKNTSEMQEMLFAKGINWNDYPAGFKRGRVVAYRETTWCVEEPPVFTQERGYLRALIPVQERWETP